MKSNEVLKFLREKWYYIVVVSFIPMILYTLVFVEDELLRAIFAYYFPILFITFRSVYVFIAEELKKEKPQEKTLNPDETKRNNEQK